MVASMLRAQRRDPAKAQAKCAFATNYPLANRQLRSPLKLRYRMQRDKPYPVNGGMARQQVLGQRILKLLGLAEQGPKTAAEGDVRCPSSKQMGLLSVFHKGGSG